ncbi:MAG TPA: Asp23/Gls24 family envelope stress response protein [Amycolatopsis sp.]|uniref:Asp23/Gls24 family envelope stress response protein n=1 Tax=Amycolatopsis sp. TaxID=37632 RepID=UPI002F42C4BB
MSDVINSIFGRPKNENTGSGEYAYGTAEPEAAAAPESEEAATVVEETESAPETETAAETAEDATVEVDAGESEGDDADAVTEEAETDSDAADDVTETEDVAEAEPVEEAEPVAETEPAAEAVVAEAEAVIAEAEPVAARPAAGTRGSTTVADGVVAKIITRVAARAEGVHSLDADGIKVELADEVAWITIPLVLEFGHAIKVVGERIRMTVIDAVEQYLGLDVEVVDLHITDIHFPEAD